MGCAGRSTIQGWLLGVDRFIERPRQLLGAARLYRQYRTQLPAAALRHSRPAIATVASILNPRALPVSALLHLNDLTATTNVLPAPEYFPNRANHTLPIYFASNLRTEFTV